ncbi:hypothetical protein AB0L34_31855 [Micromonospora sp. NPDC052213]|uniref:hypothetical protein n=1 Tax=Micromonospora sp. NPDC052213 TaxID=3155812 RepID=UPI003431127D
MPEKYPLIILNEFFEESEYHQYIQPVHTAIMSVAEDLRIPPFETTVVMSGDMTASVNRRTKDKSFSPERVGGQVAGKTMPIDPTNFSQVDLVMDMGMMNPVPEGTQLGMFIYLLAHELGHAVIGRQRTTSGDTPAARRVEPSGMAGLYGLEAIDEWRCDQLADIVLGGIATVNVDGNQSAVRYGLMLPSDWTADLRNVVDEVVYPAWPDLVWSYRIHDIDLEQMWEQLQTQTSQVLIFLAHNEARALSAGRPSPLTQLAGHRGVDLYLGPAWSEIMKEAETQPILASQDEFQRNQDDLLIVCRSAITKMWTTLGVTGRRLLDGTVYLDVSDPAR